MSIELTNILKNYEDALSDLIVERSKPDNFISDEVVQAVADARTELINYLESLGAK